MSQTLGRTLVIGGTGFVGSHLARRLADPSAPVDCLAFTDRGQESRLPQVDGIVPLPVDPSSDGSLARALSSGPYDVVFNLAAAGVRADSRAPTDLLQGNPLLLSRLLLALRDAPPRLFVHTGSWLEYAPSGSRRHLTEESSLLCDSLYGASKAAATLLGNALALQLGIPFVIPRLFSVFGPGESPERLIPHVVSGLAAGREVDLTTGTQVRDFVFIEDVLDALVAASSAEVPEHHRVYNVCSGRPTSVRAVAEMVADAMNKSRQLLAFGKKTGRSDEPEWAVGDPSRMRDATGWTTHTTIEEGIRLTVAKAVQGLP